MLETFEDFRIALNEAVSKIAVGHNPDIEIENCQPQSPGFSQRFGIRGIHVENRKIVIERGYRRK